MPYSFLTEPDDSPVDLQQTAKLSLEASKHINPDKEAQRRKAYPGVPAEVSRSAYPDGPQVKPEPLSRPGAKFFADQDNAAVAHDDVSVTDSLFKGWNLGASVSKNLDTRAVNEHYARLARGEKVSADEKARINQLELKKYEETNGFVDAITGLGTSVINPVTAAGAGAGAATFGSAAAITGPGAVPAAITGALAGGNAGQSTDTAIQTTGELYRELSKLKDDNGRPYNKTAISQMAQAAGLLVGGINFGTNVVTAGVGGKVESAAVKKILLDPVAIKAVVKATLEGGGIGGAMGAITGLIKEGTKSSVTGKVDLATQGQSVLEQTVAGAALGGGLAGGVGVATKFGSWANASRQSKLINRNPELARRTINEAVPDPLTVPSDRFISIARERGVTPDKLAKQLGAERIGSEYNISAGDYAVYVARDKELAPVFDAIVDKEIPNPARVIDEPPTGPTRDQIVTAPEQEMADALRLYGSDETASVSQAKAYAIGLENIEKMAGLPQDYLHSKYGTRVISQEVPVLAEGLLGEAQAAGLLPREAKTLKSLEDKGGQGMFRVNKDTGKAEIYLTKNSNLTTFTHETAHMYRRVIDDLVKDGKATPELISIHEDIKSFLGAKKGFSRSQEEKFARGFEQYIRSGKAEKNSPVKAFAKLKEFMLGVYENARALDVTLTPKATKVFDRLTEARSDIKAVAPHLTPETTTKAAELYANRVESKVAAREVAASKEIPAETARLDAEHRQEMTAKIIETIRNNDDFKLDEKATEAIVSVSVMDMLPEGIFIDGGIHPDELAHLTNHKSGVALLDDLIDHELYNPEQDARSKFDAKNPHVDVSVEAKRAAVENMRPQMERNITQVVKERGKRFYKRTDETSIKYGSLAAKDMDLPIATVDSMKYADNALRFADEYEKYTAAGDIELAADALRNQELAVRQYENAVKIEKFRESLTDKVMEDGREIDLYQMSMDEIINGAVKRPSYSPVELARLEATSQRLGAVTGRWNDQIQGITMYRALTKGKRGGVKDGLIMDKFYTAFVDATDVQESSVRTVLDSTKDLQDYFTRAELDSKSEYILNDGRTATKGQKLGIALKEYMGVNESNQGAFDSLSVAEQDVIERIAGVFDDNNIRLRPSDVRDVRQIFTGEVSKFGNRAFKQARADIRFLLNDPVAKAALERAVGYEGVQALERRYELHLQIPTQIDMLSKLIDKVRQNNAIATVAALNPLSAVKQFGDLAVSVPAYTGEGNWIKGAPRVATSLLENIFGDSPVVEGSAHIRRHSESFNKEVLDSIKTSSDKKVFGVSYNDAVKLGYKFVTEFDLKARKIAFTAVYKESVARGMTADAAKAHADQMVISSFGSSDRFNQSVLEQSALGKVVGTYGITARTLASGLTELGPVGGALNVLIPFVAVDIAMGLASGYGMEDIVKDPAGVIFNSFVSNLIGAATGSVLISAVSKDLLTKANPSLKSIYGPVGSASAVVKIGKKTSSGGELTEKDAKTLVKSVAKLTGIPIVGGVVDQASFIQDRAEGVPLGTIPKDK